MIRDVLGILAGFVVGLLSGTMGVGGGVIAVPIMVVGFGLTQHVAQGTSLLAIIPTSVVGAGTHYRYGNIVLRAALWMGLAGAAGALLGAAVALHLPREWLARVFALFLLFSAYRLWPLWPKREKKAPPSPA